MFQFDKHLPEVALHVIQIPRDTTECAFGFLGGTLVDHRVVPKTSPVAEHDATPKGKRLVLTGHAM